MHASLFAATALAVLIALSVIDFLFLTSNKRPSCSSSELLQL